MSTTRTLLLLSVIAVSTQLMSCQKDEVSDVSPAPDLSTVNNAFTATPPPDYTNEIASTLKSTALRIEAESYTRMNGVMVENCREGGKNVGYIHAGDWMEYAVNVGTGGSQTVSFRVAGPGGSLQIKKTDGTVLGTITLPRTAGGQVYATGNATVNLPAGQQTLRIQAQTAGWNFNWFELANGGAASSPGTSNPSNPTNPSTPPTNAANLLLTTTFEADAELKKWEKELCRSGALRLSSEVPARKGTYSARFEFSKEDVLWYNYIRAEIRQKSFPDPEQWFGFSNYLPGDFVTDPLAEKIAQWHDVPDFHLGETWRSPPISFGIQNGRYYLNIMWASKAVNTTLTRDGEKRIDLGPVDKMKWNDWVFHIKFSYKSDGILEVWKNKTKVFSLYGPNSFNDISYPYLKIGIYKWGWDGWASYSPASKRVLYYDEVRIGNHNSNLNQVSPQ